MYVEREREREREGKKEGEERVTRLINNYRCGEREGVEVVLLGGWIRVACRSL